MQIIFQYFAFFGMIPKLLRKINMQRYDECYWLWLNELIQRRAELLAHPTDFQYREYLNKRIAYLNESIARWTD